jgi:glycosyltransferase involved in cell wall biosynthesis
MAAAHAHIMVGDLARSTHSIRSKLDSIRGHRPGAINDSACFSSQWTSATTYCSIGMDWLYNDLRYLSSRKETLAFGVALMIHDLLPEFTPQFSGLDLAAHYVKTVELADVVVVNSDATAADVRRFAADHHLSMPAVVKIPMASALRDLTPTAPPPLADGTNLAALADSGYVLCVGTITIRKNHQLLFDVWEHLIETLPPGDVPPLVIAGARGWLSDETMSRLQRTPAFKGIVHHIPDATDHNIAWLYQHATFTVYPSLYEGWGLPVSESHDFGKVCITTNRSSLPEAGHGLAEHLDPHDRNLWTEHILRYWTDTNHRTEREQRIHHEHHPVTTEQATNTILNLTR